MGIATQLRELGFEIRWEPTNQPDCEDHTIWILDRRQPTHIQVCSITNRPVAVMVQIDRSSFMRTNVSNLTEILAVLNEEAEEYEFTN